MSNLFTENVPLPSSKELIDDALCAFCRNSLNGDNQNEWLLACLCKVHVECFKQVFHTSMTLSLTQGVVTCGNCERTMTIDDVGVLHLEPTPEDIPIEASQSMKIVYMSHQYFIISNRSKFNAYLFTAH